MSEKTILSKSVPDVEGSILELNDEGFYCIENYDQLPPFLMTIVSPGDQWMYISSSGGLTMGRVRAENCFFPYETVDHLHDSHRHTGPITCIRKQDETGEFDFWRPFTNSIGGKPAVNRRLLKHLAGNQIIFEEKHNDLGLTFRYSWRNSEEYGFVRTATLQNNTNRELKVELVDGLQNICPSGVPLSTYQRASCLIDAYKHNEYDAATGMGIYSLTSKIVDRAEAVESLEASTVWSSTPNDSFVFMSLDQLRAFQHGDTPSSEFANHGQKGNYFLSAKVTLSPGESRSWYLVADVTRDHQQIAQIRKQILDGQDMSAALEEAIDSDHLDLLKNIAGSDGLQVTGSKLSTAHHLANVLFNNMRGGVPAENYVVESSDFRDFVQRRNKDVALTYQMQIRRLPEKIDCSELITWAEAQGDRDLVRLSMEYLPLVFGRRHGDPSRPWNAFEILFKDDDGARIYHYQGNWRDIFQNWEALCLSFPALIPSVVAKFVNATTVDGFNPYRITRDGIDWETLDPEDPWSNIGYWGDHQIVYLTKLLEAFHRMFPDRLDELLEKDIFCYANVPYRIKPYDEILEDCTDTIAFDAFTAKLVDRRVEELGTDGKLVLDSQDSIYRANLAEKLLVPVLSKLSNFVIDGGIWLNTQRPEWNDANNALVGSGLSMVTVCYLRRHLALLIDLLKGRGEYRFAISVEVEQWFRKVKQILQDNRQCLQQASISNSDRGRILDNIGRVFSDYRLKVYEDGFSGKHTIASSELIECFAVAIEYLDHSIRACRRSDRLYHGYNLLEFDDNNLSVSVNHLYEMLEGQVAALSTGMLDVGQAIELVDAMFSSKLYRSDLSSFMLYPNRDLPGFLQRNRIMSHWIEEVELLKELLAANDSSIVSCDAFGEYHFHSSIEKRADLEDQLDRLALDDRWSELVDRSRKGVLDVFEHVFSHKTYTGRSGTMYGYEGLGCIYWHMVSKLLLAVQENIYWAQGRQASASAIESLVDYYYLIRGGLSSDKTPSEYGAVPTDPYSHTPRHGGAQQPGMTGQVKEEVLTRWGELGVRVKDGKFEFLPILLRRREFLTGKSVFRYFDLAGEEHRLELQPQSLAFTICQVPILYRLTTGEPEVQITYADGRTESRKESILDSATTADVIARKGTVSRIDVAIPESQILRA